MSEDWFDKSYRSDESPPAELDIKILKNARRATRRRGRLLMLGGVFTLTVAVVGSVLLTNVELNYRPAGGPLAPGAEPSAPAHLPYTDSGEANDGDIWEAEGTSKSPEAGRFPESGTFDLPSAHEFTPLNEPTSSTSPPLQMVPSQTESAMPLFLTENCARSSLLVGPFGGWGRQDHAELCLNEGVLRIDFVWDGEPSCPSRLQVEAPADTRIYLDDGDLAIGSVRYSCTNGQWTWATR